MYNRFFGKMIAPGEHLKSPSTSNSLKKPYYDDEWHFNIQDIMVFWRFNYTAPFHSQKEKAEVSYIFFTILGRKNEICLQSTAYTMEFFDRVSNPEQIFTFQLSMQWKTATNFKKKKEIKRELKSVWQGRFFSQYVYFLNGSSSISWMEARLFWLEKSVWLKLLMAWLSHEDPSRPQAGCVIKHNDWVIFHVFLSSSSKPGFYSSVIDWLIVWLMLW